MRSEVNKAAHIVPKLFSAGMELSEEERYEKFFGGSPTIAVEETEERREVLDPGFANDEATALLLKIVAEEVNVAGASKAEKETSALAVAAATTLAARVGVFDTVEHSSFSLQDESVAETDLAKRGLRLVPAEPEKDAQARFLVLVHRGRLVAVRADVDETMAPCAVLALARLVDACVRCSLVDSSTTTLVEARLDQGDLSGKGEIPFAHLIEAREACSHAKTCWPESLAVAETAPRALEQNGPVEIRCYLTSASSS